MNDNTQAVTNGDAPLPETPAPSPRPQPQWNSFNDVNPYHPNNDVDRTRVLGSSEILKPEEAKELGLTNEGLDSKRLICPYIGSYMEQVNSRSEREDIEIYARTPALNTNDPSVYPGTGHLITFGSTRSGKGTGQILTNLLNWQGSVVVLDIKGENYQRSAGQRASTSETGFHQAVYRFSPFEDHTDVWNPLLSIRTRLDGTPLNFLERCQEEEDARYLANLIITPSGHQSDQFWEQKAKSLLVGLLLHVRTADLATEPPTEDTQHLVYARSLYEVARLAALDNDNFCDLLGDMRESTRCLINLVGTSFEGYLAHEGKLGQSIKASLLQHLEVWSYERLHRATYQADSAAPGAEPAPNAFEFATLRNGATSVYLVIPPEYLSEYRSVLRILIGCAIRQLKESYVSARTHPEYAQQPPVLFLLDEFPQLAYMAPIEEGLTYLAGYDIRLWLFLQDINQLKTYYPNSWESFLANTEFKCFFGVNDINTAKLVSEMTGTINAGDVPLRYPRYPLNPLYKATLPLQGFVTARSLLTPDEVIRMPPTKQIVFIKGLKPLYLDLTPYYYMNKLVPMSQLPPPHPIHFV